MSRRLVVFKKKLVDLLSRRHVVLKTLLNSFRFKKI